MSDQFSIKILGNPSVPRTEAEVYIPGNADEPVALVYESQDGWVVEPLESAEPPNATVLNSAVESAKARLSQYVNRTGRGAPAGLAVPGLSLWLMEKLDGTAMGRRLR